MAMIINIAEAKAHLPQIIERACNGEKITIAKNNFPLVDLIPHQKPAKRQLGIGKGLIHYHDDIFTIEQEDVDPFYESSPLLAHGKKL